MIATLGRYLLIGILVFAPLHFGGNRPIALLALEVLALLLMALLAFQTMSNHGLKKAKQFQLNKAILFFLLLLFIWPLLTLIPIPFSVWQSIPSRQAYASALALIEPNQQPLPLSLVPALTEFSWLALIPPLVVYLYVVNQTTEQVSLFIKVFLAVATIQAMLALIQHGQGVESAFRLSAATNGASATGTYANRDHLAGLLEMALPVALSMLAAQIGKSKQHRQYAVRLRQKLAYYLQRHLNATAWASVVSIVLLLGLIFTRSRTGVALSIVIICVSGVVYAKKIGARYTVGSLGVFSVLGFTLASMIGLVPILNRFTQEDPLKDWRWLFNEHTWQAIVHFFPFGSGVGTYQHALQAFQPNIPSNILINHAHNDYLEWLMEGGLVAGIVMACLLCCYILRCLQLMTLQRWSSFQFVQIGAGIGLFAMLLHTFLDFNLHIPANQIAFALLAAVFFHQETSNKTR